jgi:hypothetical protein
MNAKVQDPAPGPVASEAAAPGSEFDSLLRSAPARDSTASVGASEPEASPSSSAALGMAAVAPVIGVLVGFIGEGRVPLVTFAGQPGTAALSARSVIDLAAAHIGKDVVLLFDSGDTARPIVIGVVREAGASDLAPQPGTVEVDVDGLRMTVSAKDQLVLKCGQASITLTRAGKVLIEGTYVSSRSSGVQRIKGGSIQLN